MQWYGNSAEARAAPPRSGCGSACRRPRARARTPRGPRAAPGPPPPPAPAATQRHKSAPRQHSSLPARLSEVIRGSLNPKR
eukprot:1175385-Prorocentrum_minimum.AAC.1